MSKPVINDLGKFSVSNGWVSLLSGLGYVSQLSLHLIWSMRTGSLSAEAKLHMHASHRCSLWNHVRAGLKSVISKCSHCILYFALQIHLYQPSIFLNEGTVSMRLWGFAPKKMNTELSLWHGYFSFCLEQLHIQLNQNNYLERGNIVQLFLYLFNKLFFSVHNPSKLLISCSQRNNTSRLIIFFKLGEKADVFLFLMQVLVYITILSIGSR